MMMDELDEEFYNSYIDNTNRLLMPIYSKNNNHREQMAIDLQSGDTNKVAMSHIDSDDFISEKYFEEINASIHKAKSDGVSFNYVISTDGYITDLKYMNKVVKPKSPFLTLYRENYTDQTVYGFDHSAVLEKKHVACSSAHWIQIYHGSNISNRFEKQDDSRSVHEFWPGDFHRPERESYKWPVGTRV
jgi:hypothetical protein